MDPFSSAMLGALGVQRARHGYDYEALENQMQYDTCKNMMQGLQDPYGWSMLQQQQPSPPPRKEPKVDMVHEAYDRMVKVEERLDSIEAMLAEVLLLLDPDVETKGGINR